MAIIASAGSGSTFTPAPQGVHQAVCCDVVDLGILEVTYPGTTPRKQHKIRIVWQIEELMDSGKPFLCSKRYTLSLHEKASLRADLESWRGRPFTDAELSGFDVENVIGVNCLLNIVHAKKGTDVFANISAVMPLKKGMGTHVVSRDYVRMQDRTIDQTSQAQDDHRPDDPFGDEPPFAF